MSGHSKWASIKHKKGANDAKRGKIFTKIIKEITVASRMGGGDENLNPRLRTAVLKAKDANMPKDNIDRAIKKGIGELDGVTYVELTYEGYGPGGVAILIDTLTDNKNRTAADVRSQLTKGGGNLGDTGCVSYLFKRKGIIGFDSSRYSEDDIIEVALESGAEDVSTEGDTIEVVTEPDDFEKVRNALADAGFEKDTAEISMIPDSTVKLDKEKTAKALRLVERLEDLDDVQSVSTNLEIPDDFDFDE
ncbi:MAG: YebC/PmpR family DNA-binding transcriptional regulator [Spirochaetia bacterium]|jgi:YebC/PmpR family DNA-binding regulatory protein|nr:YebC/PmpR family DNA-binding transcriptional regulator [Spirochaetia bacterium]